MTAVVLLPFSLVGRVVPGLGRGASTLGFPTANVDPAAYRHLFGSDNNDADDGVYYGWARVVGRDETAAAQPMVMSVGTNPHFAATGSDGRRTLEVHILKQYAAPFYGALLCVHAIGYLRPMRAFDSTDELVAAIRRDVHVAWQRLAEPEGKESRLEAIADWRQQLARIK